MNGFLLRLAISAFGLWVASKLVPGVQINDGWTLIWARAVARDRQRAGAADRAADHVAADADHAWAVHPGRQRGNDFAWSPRCSTGSQLSGFGAALLGALVVSITSWLASSFIGPKGRYEVIVMQRRSDPSSRESPMFTEPDRRRIYLLRHAEAAYLRDDGTPVADTRVAGLTPNGEAQARRQSEVLADVEFDRAVCSGLPRTRATAGLHTRRTRQSPRSKSYPTSKKSAAAIACRTSPTWRSGYVTSPIRGPMPRSPIRVFSAANDSSTSNTACCRRSSI